MRREEKLAIYVKSPRPWGHVPGQRMGQQVVPHKHKRRDRARMSTKAILHRVEREG